MKLWNIIFFTLTLIFCLCIGYLPVFKDTSLRSITLIVFLVFAFTAEYIANRNYYRNQEKEPIKKAKVRVVKKYTKYTRPTNDETKHFFNARTRVIFLLLEDNRKIRLAVSPIQYKLLNKGDDVELIYQGDVAHALKRDSDKSFIYNEAWNSEIKLAKYFLKHKNKGK